MRAWAWLTGVTGTVFAVFVLPYVLAVFAVAPNGTETLLLVALLWTACWAFGRNSRERLDQ